MSTLNEKLQSTLQDAKPTLIEFYADWCPHCQRMMPIVAQLKEAVKGEANVIQIEGDQNPDLMRQFQVESYPTWFIFKDGQLCWRDGGEKPYSELKDVVDKYV
jgi:thioredoxin 1